MSVHIVVLRGINVGGHGKLPMVDLRRLIQAQGASDVSTYIQSGNAVCRGAIDPAGLSGAIAAEKGFRPHVQVRRLDEWEALVRGMPWPEVSDHRALHLFLTETESPVALSDLVALAGEGERLHRMDRAIWLHTPGYLSGSRVGDRMERLIRVPTTARNWRTVRALLNMGRALS